MMPLLMSPEDDHDDHDDYDYADHNDHEDNDCAVHDDYEDYDYADHDDDDGLHHDFKTKITTKEINTIQRAPGHVIRYCQSLSKVVSPSGIFSPFNLKAMRLM